MGQLTLDAVDKGYCKCGCGNKTPIAPRNRKSLGWVKGEHLAYIRGHNRIHSGGPTPAIGMKWCCTCEKVKPVDDFHKHSRATDGRQGQCKVCSRASTNAYRSRNPERAKMHRLRHTLKAKFGMTIEEYECLYNAQNGLCAICGKPEIATQNGRVKRLAIDHCHKTGKIRGLLCLHCNVAIAMIDEDEQAMVAAIAYVRRHNDTTD